MDQKGKLFRSMLSGSLHAILLTGLFLSASVSGDAKSELDALTGGIHSRVAWREGGDQIKGGSKIVKGFDSKTGEIHTIWSDGAIKSVLAAGGNKLLVTSSDYKVWVVDWDGSNKKQLATGSVSDGWHDPETSKDWAIYRGSGGVFRVLIDDPSQNEQIYNGGEGHQVYPWFQISADGKKAASFFPWSKGGVWDGTTKKVTYVTKGCWSGMASDNSYNWFHLAGNHTSLAVFNDTKKLGSVNAMPPGVGGKQIYCPRAAEGPEKGGLFITLCGGYPGYNKNGNTVEIFVAKMNSSYTGITGWARITNNSVPDQHPSVWIGVKGSSSPATSMSLSPAGKLSITAKEGASTVESKTITVTPDKGELDNVTAESDQQWLKVTVKKSGNKWEVENKPDVSGLSAKIHKANVTIKASNAEPPEKTYEVELTVEGAARLAGIKVVPIAPIMVKAGKTETFSIEAMDQYGKPMSSKPSVTWSANNGAEIDEDGKFTAPKKTGEYTVTAQAGDIKGTVEVTVVTLEITSDHKGKSYGIGDEVTVKWDASDQITGASLWISIDKGRNWMIINKKASIDVKDNKGTYTWKIPEEFDGVSLENTEAMFQVSDYTLVKLTDRSDKFSITSTAIVVKGFPTSFKPMSMKMIGPRTLDLHINHKGSFEIEFIDPKGKTVEKFSGHGPLNVRWIGETPGVYVVRLNSRLGEISKKFILW